MRKIIYITGLFLFLFARTYSIGPGKLVSFDELKFNSYFEELAFYQYDQGAKNYLMLFAAIDPDVTSMIFEEFKKELSREVNRLDTRKLQRVKEERKIKLIYDHVNQQVFTRYREKILFPHIFVNGTFNCLTASAYYGFLMDSLGIEYDFRETYDHVHPVAYPHSLKIKIETTDPIAGVQYYDEKLKIKFVNYLLERKLITRNEYYANSIEELFNEYFLPESSVGLLELAGLHYLNDALYKYDGEEYQAAFEQIKKAYFLYPSERMMLLFHFILAGAINDADFLKEENAWLLVYLSRLPDESINPDEVASGYMILTERILFNSSLTEYYDNFFYLLDAEMEDGLVKNVISFQYHFLRGKSLLVQYRFKEAMDLFIKAYEINPGNLELQSLLISSIAASLENTPAEVLVNDLEQYAEELPVLSENGMFVSLQLMSYLMWVEQLFDFGEIERAHSTLSKFEKLYKQNPGVDVDYEHVGDAYSAAAVYYFKHYNKEEAIRYLKKGLEIAPENYELRYRLKSLKNP